MMFSAPFSVLAFGALAVAQSLSSSTASSSVVSSEAIVYETVTVTDYTTFCAEPTIFSHGTNTFTVTDATTLTITDCPCTLVRPVTTTPCVGITKTYTSCSTPTAPGTDITVAPAPPGPTVTNAPLVTSVIPCATCGLVTGAGTGTPTGSPVLYTGAADRNAVGSLVGFGALMFALM